MSSGKMDETIDEATLSFSSDLTAVAVSEVRRSLALSPGLSIKFASLQSSHFVLLLDEASIED